MAILGSSTGAKATNIEWSVSCIRLPFTLIKFSAVPVLAAIFMPSIWVRRAVPAKYAIFIPLIIGSKCLGSMVVCLGSVYSLKGVTLLSIFFTM